MHHTPYNMNMYGMLVATATRYAEYPIQTDLRSRTTAVRWATAALRRCADKIRSVHFKRTLIVIFAAIVLLTLPPQTAFATDPVGQVAAPPAVLAATASDATPESWAVHGQLTNIAQKHSHFSSPYSGPNSLDPDGRMEETTDLTLFAGVRLWQGAELWINPEIDQGFGFNNTLGAAGFPNGGAYKLGSNAPYLRLPRAFIRQTISLGGENQTVDAAANQLRGVRTADNLIVTAGKFAVTDVFDTNTYAHDPRADFLNWSIIDAGPFDYAADSWGYTYGAAAEWSRDWFTLRGGVFQLSEIPNGKVTGLHMRQNAAIAEFEIRHQLTGHPGKLKLLAFRNHGNMGAYRDALQFGADNATAPDVSMVRKIGSRAGMTLNLEQEIAADVGAFARLGINGGDKEAYEFSDINKSLSAGLSIKGQRWQRPDDTLGLAFAVNALSGGARDYFAAGGLGILIGDGALNYGRENILEAYYTLRPTSHIAVTLDLQRISNPGYNRDRGPVNIVGVRAHAEF